MIQCYYSWQFVWPSHFYCDCCFCDDDDDHDDDDDGAFLPHVLRNHEPRALEGFLVLVYVIDRPFHRLYAVSRNVAFWISFRFIIYL